jgi:hypothetical protein
MQRIIDELFFVLFSSGNAWINIMWCSELKCTNYISEDVRIDWSKEHLNE